MDAAKYLLLALFLLIYSFIPAQQKTIHFINGQWFNGTGFVYGDFYTVNGFLTKKVPAAIDTTVDLKNQYIIPPFGEAHNHSPDVKEDLPFFIERYLADGIYYIKNPNSIPFTTKKIENNINTPQSVDVLYANGGLTSAGGHPTGLYNYLLSTIYKNSITGWTNRSMEGHAYYVINSAEDFEKKWPFILADKPGFIKLYLLYSEEYEKRKTDTAFNGRKGLNPALLKKMIQVIHSAGLTVSCHAETPADVLNAVKAGANEINHLPGYQVQWKDGYNAAYYLLPQRTARLMKKKNVHADATYSLSATELTETDTSMYNARRAVQIKNLRLLKKFKVPVTVACDSYNLTAKTEIQYLHDLGVYTNLELLKMWCQTTPSVIFPKRKITLLQEGYEASFLVLKNNPLENFDALFQINVRVKQGVLLW